MLAVSLRHCPLRRTCPKETLAIALDGWTVRPDGARVAPAEPDQCHPQSLLICHNILRFLKFRAIIPKGRVLALAFVDKVDFELAKAEKMGATRLVNSGLR